VVGLETRVRGSTKRHGRPIRSPRVISSSSEPTPPNQTCGIEFSDFKDFSLFCVDESSLPQRRFTSQRSMSLQLAVAPGECDYHLQYLHPLSTTLVLIDNVEAMYTQRLMQFSLAGGRSQVICISAVIWVDREYMDSKLSRYPEHSIP